MGTTLLLVLLSGPVAANPADGSTTSRVVINQNKSLNFLAGQPTYVALNLFGCPTVSWVNVKETTTWLYVWGENATSLSREVANGRVLDLMRLPPRGAAFLPEILTLP